MKRLLISLCVLIAPIQIAISQTSVDSLRLPALRESALSTDPRAGQLEIVAAQSALRLRNITADLKPTLSFDSQAQYQSDVASIPVNLPGVTIPKPPKDTYDARLSAQQRLFDPSLNARRSVERAQTAESQARVRAVLYSINESVNTAFFTALRSQAQAAELSTTIIDLEAQISVADDRVKAGTALTSESNTLRAELLRRRQAVAEQNAVRHAAIAVLADLTGKPIDPDAPLATPDLSQSIPVSPAYQDFRNRPEYQQFELSREALRRSEAVLTSQDKPRLLAFGSLGYGKPGLKQLSDKFDSYWLTGLKLQWTPWNWGTTGRDRQVLALQRDLLTTEEKNFTNSLRRAVEQDIVSIERLETALVQDDEIIALRESILVETRTRYSEAVITSADYVDRQTDVLAARLARSTHRVELAQARAHLLTTLGIEVR
ncbi:MAG: TolC family protein [Gemmatimonadales bacterium]